MPQVSPGLGPVLGPAGHGIAGDIAGRAGAQAQPSLAGFVPAIQDGGAAHYHMAHLMAIILGVSGAGIIDLVHFLASPELS